ERCSGISRYTVPQPRLSLQYHCQFFSLFITETSIHRDVVSGSGEFTHRNFGAQARAGLVANARGSVDPLCLSTWVRRWWWEGRDIVWGWGSGGIGVLTVRAAYVRRDPRAFTSAPPGSLYRPTLSARITNLARSAMRQAGAACFSAMVTALVVMIAVSRNPSLPDDYEPGDSPNTTLAYRQAEPSMN